MTSDFFAQLKAVTRARKLERLVQNSEILRASNIPHKMIDETKTIVISTAVGSVVFHLTVNKWTHKANTYFGTLRDCLNWIERQNRLEIRKSQKQV